MNVFQDIITFFEGLAGNPAVDQAKADVVNAANSVEAAVPSVADTIANEALAKIPFGSLAEPIVDGVINSVIGKLFARLSDAGKAQAAAQVTMAPIPNP